MASFIVIEAKKDTEFDSEAKTVLESHKFTEVSPGTYRASANLTSTAAKAKLKNLESYKKYHSTAGIKIYHGSLSSS